MPSSLWEKKTRYEARKAPWWVDAGNMSCYLQHHFLAEGLLCLVGDEFVSPLFSTLIRPQKHIVEVAETEV